MSILRQKEIVQEVGGVGHDERVGGEELSELVTSPQTWSAWPRKRPSGCKACRGCPIPVDTSPTVVKFPALAVLMVNVLPVIPVAELSRPTLAAARDAQRAA